MMSSHAMMRRISGGFTGVYRDVREFGPVNFLYSEKEVLWRQSMRCYVTYYAGLAQ
jgi:hypothetical protein